MQYWLVKTEPSTYSFEDLLRDKKTTWDGVRNYLARNNLKCMKVGDQVLIYHSVVQKEVVGVGEVSKEFFQDPTTEDSRWVAVEIVPKSPLKKGVSLETIKQDPQLQHIHLVRQGRLSVMPLGKEEYEKICSYGS